MGEKDLRTFDTSRLFDIRDFDGLQGKRSVGKNCENPECADGFIAVWTEGRVTSVKDCTCRTKRIFEASWRQVQLAEVRRVYKRYDLDKTVIDPMIEPLSLGGKGRWLCGKTQQGKTHQQGWLLKTLIETTEKQFQWVRVSIAEFFKALENKRHMIPEVQKPALEFLAKIEDADVIALHDIDKFGNMTASREESFFDLIDQALEKGKLIIATSNFTMADFCARFTNIEAKLQERDGAAPQLERLKELCDEIKIVRQS